MMVSIVRGKRSVHTYTYRTLPHFLSHVQEFEIRICVVGNSMNTEGGGEGERGRPNINPRKEERAGGREKSLLWINGKWNIRKEGLAFSRKRDKEKNHEKLHEALERQSVFPKDLNFRMLRKNINW